MDERAGSWTYVLVTPDAAVSASLRWVLGRLRSADLIPVAARMVRVDSSTMLELYDKPDRARPVALPPRRAFDLWYALGPGCVVLLRHGLPDPYPRVLSVKGATNPRAAAPGTIRHRGENQLMNLVHCPDDAAAATEELGRLLGHRGANQFCRLAVSCDPSVTRLTVDMLEEAMPAFAGAEALSIPMIVNRLRLRALQILAVGGASGEVVAAGALDNIRAALCHERTELEHVETSSGRADVARRHDRAINAGLTVSWRLGQGAPAMERALYNLSALLHRQVGAGAGALDALRDTDIYLSGLERSVIEMSGYL